MSRGRSRLRNRTSTARARVTNATAKGKTTVGRLIRSAKQPSIRLGNTIGKSTKLAQQFARKASPVPRMGKIFGNVPARFSQIKLPGFKVPKLPSFTFPKIPKVKLPRLPDPIGFLRGLDLKSKIPKLGFPKIKIPDVPGFLKDKLGDVVNSVTGAGEKIFGAAEDWQAKRKRKWLIVKIVVAIIILFLGMLIWKRK